MSGRIGAGRAPVPVLRRRPLWVARGRAGGRRSPGCEPPATIHFPQRRRSPGGGPVARMHWRPSATAILTLAPGLWSALGLARAHTAPSGRWTFIGPSWPVALCDGGCAVRMPTCLAGRVDGLAWARRQPLRSDRVWRGVALQPTPVALAEPHARTAWSWPPALPRTARARVMASYALRPAKRRPCWAPPPGWRACASFRPRARPAC